MSEISCMGNIGKKNFNSPDDTQSFEKITVETVTIGGILLQKITAEPGWK